MFHKIITYSDNVLQKKFGKIKSGGRNINTGVDLVAFGQNDLRRSVNDGGVFAFKLN